MTSTLFKDLSNLDLKTDYRTGRDNAVDSFYAPCLGSAKNYFRAVGYFRSSIFILTGEAVIDFVKSGGVIHLICSPSLTSEDVKAIEEGHSNLTNLVISNLQKEIDEIFVKCSGDYSVKILATLIKVGALKIKIALRHQASGIYHEKLGIFEDEMGNAVSFIGSSNETFNAWHEQGNFESIEVFCSWNGVRESERVQRHQEDFQSLWEDRSRGVRTVDFPTALTNQMIAVAENSLDDLPVGRRANAAGKAALSKKTKLDNLLPHQSSAVENWKLNGYRGVFEHATGSGKTVTALAAINKHISMGYPALVLVPSKLLLTQWVREIEQEIPDAVCIPCGAGNISWKKNERLRNFMYGVTPQDKRIVVSTMQTGASQEFLAQLRGLGLNLLLVADECHQIGSPQNSRALSIDASKRLGLSATPERYGDADGTAKIIEYFGGVIAPVITLYDAIKAGRLVDYEYFPKVVNLSAIEAEEWAEKSREIKREIARASSGEEKTVLSNRAKMLLIERSRIAKKSITKLNLAFNIISENYQLGESWLVYCEDQSQLKSVSEGLRERGFSPLEYFSSMDGSSVETLKLFQMQGGILVSIRCLDEGVDIPAISHALILASSQNPRQFIQRRGRVLRKHPSKVFAKIYDAIVVPVSLEDEPEQFSLLKSELTRALEFSRHSTNISAGEELRLTASRLGLELNEIVNDGFEEDADNEE